MTGRKPSLEDTTAIRTKTDLIKTAKKNRRESPGGVPFLLVLSGPLKHKKVLLLASETLLGRSRKCHVRLSDPTVSQLHAAITRTPEGVFVRDLGSSNGTHLNGAAVENSRALADRDRLFIGGTELEYRAGN